VLLFISFVGFSQNAIIYKSFDNYSFLNTNDRDSTKYLITPYFSGLASVDNYEVMIGANIKKRFQNKNTNFMVWTKPEFLYFSLFDYLNDYDSISRFPGGEKTFNNQ